MSRLQVILGFLILCISGISAAQQSSDAMDVYSSLRWSAGPGTFDVTSRATITLPADYDRLDASDTKKLMELMENPSSGDDYYVGPTDNRWFAIFSYEDTGHITDDEKIDAPALLKALRTGTEAGNRERRRRGWAEMNIVGWQYEPYYEEDTNRLSWAVLAESGGVPIVNFNTRLLGRTGVMSATHVADPETLEASIAEFKEVLEGFNYKSGETYAEYRAGDKLAAYGLAALVTGGAAVAVAKGAGKGLFKAIGLGILALFAAVSGGLKRIFSRKT